MNKEVQKLAYYKWEKAGKPSGRDKEFYYEAEKEYFITIPDITFPDIEFTTSEVVTIELGNLGKFPNLYLYSDGKFYEPAEKEWKDINSIKIEWGSPPIINISITIP